MVCKYVDGDDMFFVNYFDGFIDLYLLMMVDAFIEIDKVVVFMVMLLLQSFYLVDL